MNNVRYTEINAEEAGQRLDNYLLRILKGIPKSHIYRIIRAGEVRVNKKRAKVSSRLAEGDNIRIPPLRFALAEKDLFVGKVVTEQLLKNIIFEDDSILVLNKPAGVAVHGGSGLSFGVIEALRKARPEISYLELVHRLDRETSGCLLLAKKRSMLRSIQSLLVSREIKKIYWALLRHPWQGKNILTIEVPLKKNTLKSGERMVTVASDGKPSQTVFKLLENFPQACFVEVLPKTGRTHQIRVHSAYLGHAILGDNKYDTSKNKDLEIKHRLYLHARAIQFNLNGKNYFFEADLDALFVETLNTLQRGTC